MNAADDLAIAVAVRRALKLVGGLPAEWDVNEANEFVHELRLAGVRVELAGPPIAAEP